MAFDFGLNLTHDFARTRSFAKRPRPNLPGDIGTMHTIGGMKNLVAVRQPEEMPQIVEEDGTLTPVQCAYSPYSLLNREVSTFRAEYFCTVPDSCNYKDFVGENNKAVREVRYPCGTVKKVEVFNIPCLWLPHLPQLKLRIGTVGRVRGQHGEALKSSMATYSSRIDELICGTAVSLELDDLMQELSAQTAVSVPVCTTCRMLHGVSCVCHHDPNNDRLEMHYIPLPAATYRVIW